MLSAALAVLAALAWPQADGWDRMRKLRFSGTVAVFAGFGVLTAALGALQPWNP